MSASYWRRRSREAIAKALSSADRADVPACVKAIDAAYPFGERAMWPYKMWLKERRAAIDALTPGPKPLTTCPACGAKPTKPCRDIVTGEECETHEARLPSSGPLFGGAA